MGTSFVFKGFFSWFGGLVFNFQLKEKIILGHSHLVIMGIEIDLSFAAFSSHDFLYCIFRIVAKMTTAESYVELHIMNRVLMTSVHFILNKNNMLHSESNESDNITYVCLREWCLLTLTFCSCVV